MLGPRSSARAVSFLYALLTWNPSWRSCAQEALRHSYFRMGKPSSNNQNNSETPINSISSKMSGMVSSDHLAETTPKLSLKLRPKALGGASDQNHSMIQNSYGDNRTSEEYSISNQHIPVHNNSHTISQNHKELSPTHQNSDQSRIPLPMTEIEPSWSRDSNINSKGKKGANYVRGKHASNVPVKQKQMEHLGINSVKS